MIGYVACARIKHAALKRLTLAFMFFSNMCGGMGVFALNAAKAFYMWIGAGLAVTLTHVH